MSQKVKVAFLGTGGIAAKHGREYRHHPDVQIVGGCDVKADTVNGFWDRCEIPKGHRPPAFDNAEKMYQQTKPDAVVICTPHTLHYEHASLAIAHGCHVLLEKPMVTQADHAYKLRDQVKAAGKVLVVGYNTPCTPEFHHLRELIRGEKLGKLEQVAGWLTQPWIKFVKGTWRTDPKLSGGGQAYDSGAHIPNSLCWTVEANIEQVHAYVDNMGNDVDINSSINILFDTGVMASIVISGHCTASGSHLTYMFANGRVDIDGWGGSWINIYEGDQRVKYPQITGKPLTPAGNFIDAILGRDEPRTSPANGIVQSELMDAIYESARTGQPARPAKQGAAV